jgi:integrase/recombinase XerC
VPKTSSVNKNGSRTLSWSDQVIRFSASLDTIERSKSTVRAYQGELSRFARWYRAANHEEPALAAITGTDLLEFKRDMIGRDLKPPTVNRAIAAVKTFLQWGRSASDMPEVPKRIRKSPDLLKWLDRKQQLALQRIIERAGNKRDLAIVRILLHTGLRVAELVKVEWRDVERSERKGQLTVRFGKGAKWRTIPLSSTARDAFAALDLDKVSKTNPQARVFQGPRGPIGTRAVEHMLDKYAEAAGLEHLTPHMLRHTFCKNLVDGGAGLPEVARLAGHESILTTQRYVTPSSGDLERAIERLGGVE